MPNLDLVITGDCISAVTALQNTERAVGSLQSRAGGGVGVAVSVLGARAAAKDLGSVSSAIGATHAAAAGLNRTPIAGGMVAGAAAARGLSAALATTTRQATTSSAAAGVLVGSMRSAQSASTGMGVAVAAAASRVGTGGAAARSAAAGNRALAGSMTSVAAAAEATRRHQAAMMDELARGGNLAAAQRAGIVSAADVAGAQRQRALAMAGTAYASEMAANQRMVAAGFAPSSAAMRGATRDAAGLAAGTRDLTRSVSGLNEATSAPGALLGGSTRRRFGTFADIRAGWREGVAQARAERDAARGAGGLPPVVPPRGGGGGGGGGGGDADREGAAAAKGAAEIGKGIGTMLMAGLAIGIATNASYAKYAIDAVNTTISETPALADKAKEAADELGAGYRDITEGVNMDKFADQFERLGTANRALGQMQGQIGMQNLAVKLETEAQAADTQTRALARMAPAFDAAIRGSSNLENALLEGISNPQVVNGVRALGESLAQPEIKKGLSDITTGATASALVFAKVASDVGGAVSRMVNSVAGAQNVTDLSGAIFGGGAVAALAKGGLASKSAAGLLGGSAIFGSQQLMEQGRDDVVVPSLLNMGLGALMMSAITKNPLAIAGGGLAGQWGTIKASQVPGDAGKMLPSMMTGALGGFMAGGPWGAVAGATAGGILSGIAPGGPLAPSPQEAPVYGSVLHAYANQMRTPGALAGGGLISWATGALTDYVAETMSPGSTLGGQGPVEPGPQQPEAPKSQAEQLQERAKATRQRVNEERRSRGQRPAGSGSAPPAPLPPPSAAPVAMTQMSQAAQQATDSVVGLGQAMPQVAQQAQQMPAAVAAPARITESLQSAAVRNMSQASSTIASSAQQVGSSIPPAISQGIVKNTPQVCDAAADMGNNAVNCTARAIQYASPAKKFIALGESTGQGMAIGVNNSAGEATDAVGSMASGMLSQVGALGSGVQAASDGVTPIAESSGLMIGYVWGRSIQTGVDSVLKSADFSQASLAAVASDLAKTTLGQMGLLGIAGSGASISKGPNGGYISMPAPAINATFQLMIDGKPVEVIAQRVVDSNFDQLADSVGRQRG